MSRALLVLVLSPALLLAPGAAWAADARLVKLGDFRLPVYVAGPPGDPERVFVVERDGRIRVVRSGETLRRPFLDIRRDVRSNYEQGLLSMAFAPDYQQSGLFYVYFTDRRGHIRLQEFRRSAADPDVADPASRRLVMLVRHPRHPNHYGGQLHFGPRDGLLYVSTGDGGGKGDPGNDAQRLGSPLGKILRIDPRRVRGRPYTVPRTNPFVRRRGAEDEVYAYGLRNPFRFSFDRATGALTVADVGQDAVEEIDYLPAGRGRGANFGWRPYEGRRRYAPGPAPGHIPPVLELRHRAGYCAVIGGFVVRDPALRRLAGRYVLGDFCRPGLRSVRLGPGGARGLRGVGIAVPALSSFGEDSLGRVYAASLEGPVYRLADVAPGAASVSAPRIDQRRIPYGRARKRDMAAYALRHYGLDTHELRAPKVIVQHYAVAGSLDAIYNAFAPNRADPELRELPGVCTHFAIGGDGTIRQFVSVKTMCRHTVGLNHTAIGIEHTGFSDSQVLGNPRQLAASLRLTAWLRCAHGIELRNVIGHNESLRSPFHMERVARLRRQTHGDFKRAAMREYRRKLRAIPCQVPPAGSAPPAGLNSSNEGSPGRPSDP